MSAPANGRVPLSEMIALLDRDLDDELSMAMARGLWNRPNTPEEDRRALVRRRALETLQLFAKNEAKVRAALRDDPALPAPG